MCRKAQHLYREHRTAIVRSGWWAARCRWHSGRTCSRPIASLEPPQSHRSASQPAPRRAGVSPKSADLHALEIHLGYTWLQGIKQGLMEGRLSSISSQSGLAELQCRQQGEVPKHVSAVYECVKTLPWHACPGQAGSHVQCFKVASKQ